MPAAVRSSTRAGAFAFAGCTRPEAGQREARGARAARVGELDVHGRLPHARRQRRRRSLGDELAARDDADAVGELLGLLEVLGGEEHGRAVVVQRAHLAPQRRAAARVEAGGRLVEEQHVRPVHEREREVEPPAHAARVAADAAVGGLGEADALEQLHGAGARLGGAQPVQRALHAQQLAAGHQRVDRRLLQRYADRAPHRVAVADDVMPGDERRPEVGRSSVVRIRTTVVLPAPLGPRNP